MNVPPYLYAEQLAQLTPWTVQAIHAKIRRGELCYGEHYFQEGHRGRLIFKWEAVVRLIEREGSDHCDGREVWSGDQGPQHCSGQVIDVKEAEKRLHRLLDRRA